MCDQVVVSRHTTCAQVQCQPAQQGHATYANRCKGMSPVQFEVVPVSLPMEKSMLALSFPFRQGSPEMTMDNATCIFFDPL